MTKQISTEQKTYDDSLDSHTDTDTKEYKIDNHRKSWSGLCERAWYQFQSQVGVKKFTKDIVSIFGLWFIMLFLGSNIGLGSLSLISLLLWSTAVNVSLQDISRFSAGYILSISLGISLTLLSIDMILIALIVFMLYKNIMLHIKHVR
jgi:hypothetical protein